MEEVVGMRKILITGGCGFVGSNLALEFIRRGFAVTAFDNLSRKGSEILKDRLVDHGVSFVHGDVRDPAALNALVGDYALMLECSAEPSVLMGTRGQDARYLLDVNLQGAINCFEWARERMVPVIFLSSSRVYPYDQLNAARYQEADSRFEYTGGCAGVTASGVSVQMPLAGVRSLYGASKLCAEYILQEYAAQYGLPSIIDRCGVIAGPWQLGKVDQGVFTFWLANHYFNKPLKYIGFGGAGKQVRDVLHVDDLAALVVKQAEALMTGRPAYRGKIFNAGGSVYSNLSLRETTVICAELTGNKVPIGSETANRPADLVWFVMDNGETEPEFSWRPVKTGRDVLSDTYQWLRAHEKDFVRIFA